MSINRRQLLLGTAALTVAGVTASPFALAKQHTALLDSSTLIYMTPIRSNGNESACHGEVWFVHYDSKIFVVTKSNAWRASAVRDGITQARIWIGEFGPWKSSKDAFRAAPTMLVEGTLEKDAELHRAILKEFGAKYAREWGTWGPRFKDGLRNGSRVMLRYEVTS